MENKNALCKERNGIVDIGANEFIKMAKILGYETNNLDIFFTNNVPRKERKNILKGGELNV